MGGDRSRTQPFLAPRKVAMKKRATTRKEIMTAEEFMMTMKKDNIGKGYYNSGKRAKA